LPELSARDWPSMGEPVWTVGRPPSGSGKESQVTRWERGWEPQGQRSELGVALAPSLSELVQRRHGIELHKPSQ
jgi:hypothetical protein